MRVREVEVSLLLFFPSNIFVWWKSKLMFEITVFYFFTFQSFSNIVFSSTSDIKLLSNPIPPPPQKKKYFANKNKQEYEAILSHCMQHVILRSSHSQKIVDC